MRMLATVTVLLASLLAGCVSAEKKAAELLDTAGFEEKQNNFDHATKLYDEILKSYPDSPAAKTAATRMAALKNRKP